MKQLEVQSNSKTKLGAFFVKGGSTLFLHFVFERLGNALYRDRAGGSYRKERLNDGGVQICLWHLGEELNPGVMPTGVLDPFRDVTECKFLLLPHCLPQGQRRRAEILKASHPHAIRHVESIVL
jgi:hypothetical protein